MARFRLAIPYHRETDGLAMVGSLAAALPSDEAAVVRELVPIAAMAHLTTAGELIDRLEKIGPANRRKVLDGARFLANLESIDSIEGKRAVKEASEAALRQASAETGEAQWTISPSGAVVAVEPEAPRMRTALPAPSSSTPTSRSSRQNVSVSTRKPFVGERRLNVRSANARLKTPRRSSGAKTSCCSARFTIL